MITDYEDLYGSIAAMGSGAYLVETEEQAAELMDSIRNATIVRELHGDEFKAAEGILGLEGCDAKHIYSFVDTNEFFVCMAEDFSLK